MLKIYFFQVVLNTWSTGIKIASVFKKLPSFWELRPQTPNSSGGRGLRRQLPASDTFELHYFAQDASQFRHFSLFNFRKPDRGSGLPF